MGFEADKFKVQLKLAISRIVSLQQKHQNSLCGRRKEIADCLRNGQEERARLQVKYLVRDDYLSEVYDMLQMLLDDLLRSALLLAQEKRCDEALAPAARSLIYAAGRVDIPELLRIKEQLLSKFGKAFGEEGGGPDQRLVVKLGIRNPDAVLVNRYLLAIAQSYGLAWTPAPEEDLLQMSSSPVGYPAMVPSAPPSGPAASGGYAPPPPYSPNPHAMQQQQYSHPLPPAMPAPSPPPAAASGEESAGSDFDELSRRFEALKGKK